MIARVLVVHDRTAPIGETVEILLRAGCFVLQGGPGIDPFLAALGFKPHLLVACASRMNGRSLRGAALISRTLGTPALVLSDLEPFEVKAALDDADGLSSIHLGSRPGKAALVDAMNELIHLPAISPVQSSHAF